MKNIRINWKYIGWAGLVFTLAFGILFLFRDTIREEVLNPILYLFWLGWLNLRSIDQPILWGGLCLVLLAAALRVLFPGQTPSTQGTGESRRGLAPDRARYWTAQLALSSRNDFFYQDSRLALKRLAYGVLASREGISPEEVALRISRGEIRLPPDIQDLLETTGPGRLPAPEELPEQVKAILQDLWQKMPLFWRRPVSPPIDPRWERLVNYFEAQLEKEDRLENK